jgi:hypothetical protein
VKVLTLRRPDVCTACGKHVAVGVRAAWDPSSRTVRCLACSELAPIPRQSAGSAPHSLALVPPLQSGAGASAQREHDKRANRRQEQVLAEHPRLGRLLLAVFDEPARTKVWEQGARGERAVAAKLDELAGSHLVALHDRRMIRVDGRPSRANIDHIAVTAAGVWVIDAKTHQGTLEIRRSGGLFTPRVEKLVIAGRDQSKLLEGLDRQVEAVRAVLAEVGADVPVRGALCFVGTELPWFGDTIAGVPLVGRRGLGKLMKSPGALTESERNALARYLESRFIPA